MFLIDKNDIGFTSDFCHDIIQYRKKFLLDNNLPSKTIGKVIPSSHLPINFLQNSSEIFHNIKTHLFNSIQKHYNTNNDLLSIDSVFFVENSYENNPNYIDICKTDYTYGFLIVLNEKSYYKGGEIFINDNEINLSNNQCIIFKITDGLNIRNVYCGEQMKVLGFINHNLINNDINTQILKPCENMNAIKNFIFSQNKMKYNIHEINNLLSVDLCDLLIESIHYNNVKHHPEFNKLLKVDNEYMIQYSIDTDQYIMNLCSINNSLFNHKKLLHLLQKYSLRKFDITSYTIKILKQNITTTYYSPIMKDKNNLYENNDGKMTLLLCINDVDGSIYFDDYEYSISFKKGHGIFIPNNFLYRFYIQINFEKEDEKEDEKEKEEEDEPTIKQPYFIETTFF